MLQELGQRSLVAYLRSVFLQPNHAIFDVQKLPAAEFALSIGLPTAPKLRFLKNAGKQVHSLLFAATDSVMLCWNYCVCSLFTGASCSVKLVRAVRTAQAKLSQGCWQAGKLVSPCGNLICGVLLNIFLCLFFLWQLKLASCTSLDVRSTGSAFGLPMPH